MSIHETYNPPANLNNMEEFDKWQSDALTTLAYRQTIVIERKKATIEALKIIKTILKRLHRIDHKQLNELLRIAIKKDIKEIDEYDEEYERVDEMYVGDYV